MMFGSRVWGITFAILSTLVLTPAHVSAHAGLRVYSQASSTVAEEEFTFRIRIQNIAPESETPTLFSPGTWALHSESNPFFTNGEGDRGEGLEMLAEDGDPTMLAASLRTRGLQAGVFDTPVCADTSRPLRSLEYFEFEVTASPQTPYLSFATMLVQSNDLFLAPAGGGIPLFDDEGEPITGQFVTDKLLFWDAGTETNEVLGEGANQGPRQLSVDTGPKDEDPTVRPAVAGSNFPTVVESVRVYVVHVPTFERNRDSLQTQASDFSIGDKFQIGDVEWRVLSAENLGHELSNEEGDEQTTDERFVRVRFEFLNLGSDPLEFDGGTLRNRKGVLLRDGQHRTYPYYLVPRRGWPDGPPHEFVSEFENCYGKRNWGIWKPYILKPNSPTTCSIIYEINVDSTDLTLVASDLSDGDVSATKTVDLNLRPVPRFSVGEYVRVGDVRWQVLSAEDHGHVVEANGIKEKTRERFIEVRFQITNKGSTDLDFPGAVLRDIQGREYERKLLDVVSEDEKCKGGLFDGYVLKPNIITTCTSIYEVPNDSTGITLVANDLQGTEASTEIVSLGLSDLQTTRFYLVDEDVRVGDMCWRVLSVEELGQELRNEEGESATTEGRFVKVQFGLLNLGSVTLGYTGVILQDSENRKYSHFGERLEFIDDEQKCPPALIPPRTYSLKPNTPTTCTAIHEVAGEAEQFVLLASDLEGFEIVPIAFVSVAATTPPPIVSPGTYEVGVEISPGVYRGISSEETYCNWSRLADLSGDPESIVAMGQREGQFYVEIQDNDVGFITECNLVRTEFLEPRDPLLTSLAPGMYIVGLDISPGKYSGQPGEDLFCFWQRLKNFRGEDDSTIEWDIPGEAYVVEVEPSDYGVEFACHVELVRIPQDWQEIEDDRLGYSLAVPAGWHIINLQRVEQHPLWGMFKRLFPDAAVEIKEFVDSPAGENVGYLALELDMFPKPSIKSIALVAAVPLADDMPPEIVIQLLHSAVQSISLFPVEVQSLESGMTNNYPSIQGVVSADLSAFGLFDAHAIITALRANDTAYILVAATPVNDAEAKQKQLKQIVDTFRPR